MTRKRVLKRALIVFVVLALAATAYVVIWLVPNYRTAFVIDMSSPPAGADTTAVTRAVGSAAGNSSSRDALSLRRFGGRCGDPDNTAEVVGSGRRNSQRISDAASHLRPSGDATLHSGILAAVNDFSGIYPFRGWTANRIVVITSHGADACDSDEAAAMRSIHERIDAAGLHLEIRFIGYLVPDNEKEPLTRFASAIGAPAPSFASTADELDTALKEISTPAATEASRVDVPPAVTTTTTAPPPPPQPALIAVVVVAFVDDTSTVTTNASGTQPCTIQMIGGCQFLVSPGGTVVLKARIYNSLDKRSYAPLWFGCDEGAQATATCTLTLDTGRLVCMGTTRAPETARPGCPYHTPQNPRINIPLGTTKIDFPN